MAETPKDIKVTVTPVVDTEALEKLKAQVGAIGAGFAEAATQLKTSFEAIGKNLADTWKQQMSSAPVITPEQIAAIYGVPPEMLGLLPPDAGSSILDGIKHGTLTSEIYGWDGSVLPPGDCPSNGSPFVSGQLGPTAYLVNKHAPSPHTWEGKTPVQIYADIAAAAAAYKGATVPKKVFPAKEPGEGSDIPAHAVFTSPLIHSQAEAKETAKDQLAQHGVKLNGPVKVKQLNAKGEPTGEWITLGQVGDFKIEPLLEQIAENVQVSNFPGLDGLMNPDDYKLAQGWPPEPQTISLNFPVPTQPDTSFLQALTEEKLKMAAQAEKDMLGDYLGVDVSKASGNTVTVQSSPADPGVVQVSVTGPDGEPVKQAQVSMALIEEIAQATEKMITIDPIQTGTPWHHDWQHPIGKLSDHASGTALDLNLPQVTTVKGGVKYPGTDEMYFEVGSMSTGEPVNLGHTEAFAEAVDQHEKVTKLQTKVFNVLGKDQPVVVTGLPMHSTTHKLAHGATLIEYPDGVATLDLPGTVHTPGGTWSHTLHGKFTLATPLARKIAGLDPDPNPQISMASTTQWVAGTPAVWRHQHGWQLVSDVSTGPTQWFGEDGQPLPAEDEPLFEVPPPPPIPAAAHLWCTACDVHWMAHTGDPVACDSAGHLRPSTPLEDKQHLERVAAMEAAGLKVPGMTA
jgi:hypothetical protein